MRCPSCGRKYLIKTGYCLFCGSYLKSKVVDNFDKEERLSFWLGLIDYVFTTEFFDKFFKSRGYLMSYFEMMRDFYKRMFDEKVVGKGRYKDEPFLAFIENFCLSNDKGFQLMFFEREKDKRYITYCSSYLTGAFMVLPKENPKGTVVVEGPIDVLTTAFFLDMWGIPLRVMTAFGYHRTMRVVSKCWGLLYPVFSFFDKDIELKKWEYPILEDISFVYDKLGIEDPDDLGRVEEEKLVLFKDVLKDYVG